MTAFVQVNHHTQVNSAWPFFCEVDSMNTGDGYGHYIDNGKCCTIYL